jgi:hypothetical protein
MRVRGLLLLRHDDTRQLGKHHRRQHGYTELESLLHFNFFRIAFAFATAKKLSSGGKPQLNRQPLRHD